MQQQILDILSTEIPAESALDHVQREMKYIVETDGINRGQDCVYIAVHAIIAAVLVLRRMDPSLTAEAAIQKIFGLMDDEFTDLQRALESEAKHELLP